MKFYSIFTILFINDIWQVGAYIPISYAVSRPMQHLQKVATVALDFIKKNSLESMKIYNSTQLPINLRMLSAIAKNPRSTIYTQYLNYGCWCNFDSGNMGYGNPVDYSDSSCKQLWENYYCIDEEARASGEDDCDSAKDTYISYMVYTYVGAATGLKTAGLLEKSLEFLNNAYDLCESNNSPSICNVGACKAEVRWTYEVTMEGLFEKNSPPDNTDIIHYQTDRFYSNEYIGYDQENLCKKSEGTSNTVLECCGTVPSHKRINTINKGCCAKQLYDPQSSVCTDGILTELYV